jgi:prepilin-type N-terminal cleavage/methylation domain-containing protein
MKIVSEKKNGFTFIEIIIVLILVGIGVAVAGLGIVNVADGFLFTRETASMVSKGQVAMARLTKEFHNLSLVTSSSETSMTYNLYRDDSLESHSVTWDNENDTLYLDGETLADKVKNLSLMYYKSLDDADPKTVWTISHRIIEFTLEVTGPGGASNTFTARVVPRNL